MKTSIRLFELFFALLCLALLPNAQAVNPPPDGGYPGFNTAEGQNALFGLTTGIANTAVGWFSLFSDTDGSFNTAVGAGTLLFNLGNQSTGEGTQNTAIGTAALLFNTTGSNNTAVGTQALLNNTTGIEHTAYGSGALSSNTFGTQNTAIGFNALRSNTSGSTNVAIGRGALGLNTTGSSNIALGFNAGLNVTTAGNVISIGNSIFAANVDNSCFIDNIFGATTVNVGTPVLVDSAGQLGTISSSRRFKHEIKPMDKASEAILALKPVTFRYKSDRSGAPQFGLIAEDVAEVNSDLVVRDENGEIYSVRYDQVNAMLLNEFLKEHRRVEELTSSMAQQRKDFETAIAQQRKVTDALVARLNEQEAQIQKVSAQVEPRKPASQMLVENQ
jgi:Chaperone of endosialidase